MSRYTEIALITALAASAVIASGMYLGTIWPDTKPQTALVKKQPLTPDATVQPGGTLYRYNDTELNVTCWTSEVVSGISCIPNWMLNPNKDSNITPTLQQDKQNAKD